MKIIGISQNIKISNYNKLEDTLDHNLIILLKFCKLHPLPISNKLVDEENNHHFYSFLDKIPLSGILLSGGNDWGSFPERDKTELNLINYAIQKSIPVLGICRGMQTIAQWAGVGLKKVNDHANSSHLISSQKNYVVNSYHKYSIKNCPKDFNITAKSMDGEIEAIRHKNYDLEGWMWHPEREEEYNTQDIKNIKRIFKS